MKKTSYVYFTCAFVLALMLLVVVLSLPFSISTLHLYHTLPILVGFSSIIAMLPLARRVHARYKTPHGRYTCIFELRSRLYVPDAHVDFKA